MNTAIFAGRLGRDAETRQTNGDSVTGFSVAVDVGFGDRKHVLWVACSMWGKRGESVAPYLTKGTSVTVSGDVDLRQYEGKDGSAKAELTLNVQRLTLQGSRESRGGGDRESAPSAPPSRQETSGKDEPFNDDIPFS
jgi:single-strand DNA-binding protein